MIFLKRNIRGIRQSWHVKAVLLSLTLTAVLVGFPAHVAMANDGDLVWVVSAGGTRTEMGASIAALPDGGALVTGSFGDWIFPPGLTYTATFGTGSDTVMLTSVYLFDVFVAKYESDGSLDWAESAGGSGVDDGLGIAALADGSALVTGRFQSTATFGTGDDEVVLPADGTLDAFVAKYNADGTLDWAVSAGGEGAWTQGNSISTLSDGSALVTGYFDSTVTFGTGGDEVILTADGTVDAFVAKYNANGSLDWAVNAGGVGASTQGSSIAALSDGSALVTGYFDGAATFGEGAGAVTLTADGAVDAFVAKYHADGTIDWAVNAGGVGASTRGNSIAALSDGSALVTGYFEGDATFRPDVSAATITLSSTGGSRDAFVAMYNPDGTIGWAVKAGGAASDAGNGVTALERGSALVTGYFEDDATFGTGVDAVTLTSGGSQDVFLAKYRSDGTLAWVKQAGGTVPGESAVGYGIAADPDGGGLVTGEFVGVEEVRAGGSNSVIFGPGEDLERHLNSFAGSRDVFAAKFEGPPTYSISGVVRLSGGAASVTDVTLTLSGDDSQTISPNEDGTYSFTGLEEGDYTVTPTLGGYLFAPPHRIYTPLDSDEIDQDFDGTFVPPTFSISGTVMLFGGTASVTDVTLMLGGDVVGGVNPADNGAYTFSGLLTGDYTVTPSLAGYVFEPVGREYTDLDADLTNQDFVGTFVPGIYSISGRVTLLGGTASVTDVTLALVGDPGDTISPNEDGSFIFSDLPSGNYIVVPSLAGYIFAPANREYTPLQSDQTEQNFVGMYVPQTYSISGTVTLFGGTASVTDVLLELTGDASDSISPNEDGTYAFSDLQAGNYAVIPSLEGYTFQPINRPYAPLVADQTEQDFLGLAEEVIEARGGSGGPGPCFIATAAYGTPLDRNVGTLCDFRDRYLLTNRVGSACVRAYYRLSPPLARFIAAREPLRAAVRAVLTPIVAVARLATSLPPFARLAAVVVLVTLGLGASYSLVHRRSTA